MTPFGITVVAEGGKFDKVTALVDAFDRAEAEYLAKELLEFIAADTAWTTIEALDEAD